LHFNEVNETKIRTTTLKYIDLIYSLIGLLIMLGLENY
jgi:hypothetical protein